MSLPAIGQDPWGADLNAYMTALEARVDALEAKPDYVSSSYPWQFNTGAPPATGTGSGSQIRLNNNPSLATVIDMRITDSNDADHKPIFQQLNVGSLVRINDWDNAAIIHRYAVTGTPTMDATNVSIPVTWQSGSGVLPSAKVNVAFLVVLTP